MSDMYFENLPNTTTPLNKTNLNKLNDIKVSPTEPTTGEKVWMQKGKNLFDINSMIEFIGRYRAYDTGTFIIDNQDYNGLKIKVKPNTQYSFSSDAEAWSNFAFFDTDFQYISGDSYLNVSTFITPANCHYITLAVKNDYTWIQLEQNPTVTSYEAYIDKKIYTKNDNDEYEEFYNEYNLQNYSMIEQKIGTWIDGNDLYRVAKELNVTAGNNAVLNLPSGCSVKKCNAWLKKTSSEYENLLNWNSASADSSDFGTLYYNRNANQIDLNTSNAGVLILIVEYTK